MDLLLPLLVLGLMLLGSPLFALPQWALLQPADGFPWAEPWRLLLGHWVHHSWGHVALNGVAVAGWFVLWREAVGARLGRLVVVSLFTGAGTCLATDYAYVVGASGLLHGLYVASALGGLRRSNDRLVSAVVLAGIGIKIVMEQLAGPSADTEALVGLPVATEAHWIGAAAGVAYAALAAGLLRLRR